MIIFWTIIRILAAVVGAFLGYLIAGLVVRVLALLVMRRRATGVVVVVGRVAGAVAVGLLVYYFLHPGGSGGWGLGGGSFGLGGGTGKTGTGTATGTTTRATAAITAASKTAPPEAASDTLAIEMLGGTRYKGEGRYYLIEGKEPARTLPELEDFLQKNRGRYRKLEILLYPESMASMTAPVTQLAELARRQGLSSSITRAVR